jgi:hypothetical protein
MSVSSLAIHTGREARRSTRVSRAIRLTVVGVDYYRGPYHEEVSTVTVNCHGCMYKSKYAMPLDSLVMVALNHKDHSERISTPAHVRWTRQAAINGGLYETAIELKIPGNIWAIDSPPGDWLPFCGPRSLETGEPNAKTIALLGPKSAPSTTKERSIKTAGARAVESVSSPAARSLSQLVADLQHELETMRSRAAECIAREGGTALPNDIRAGLGEEARRIVAEAILSQAS